MLNEKPNKDFHWKNKLEEIGSLPGETFNKEASWEKLHQRMQGKSRNKNAVWYWVAAACLLLALITPWLFLTNKKGNVLVEDNPVQKKTPSTSSHLLAESNKATSAVISSRSVEKKLPRLSVEKSNKITPFDHNIIQSKIVQSKKETEEFITQKITNNAVVPVNTVISVVAILPEKKKLQVVHINELGDPVTESPNTARNYEHHSFTVKFINQEVYSSPPSSGNTGFNIFKTKPTPSN